METTGPTLTDVCLVLAPNDDAAALATEEVRARFTSLAEELLAKLIAAVAQLVKDAVENGSGSPITVTIALEADVIRGEVSDRDEPGLDDAARFEIPLA